MTSSGTFDAAYIILQSRVWQDLQQLRMSIESCGQCARQYQSAQAHAQAVLLDLWLLRDRCKSLVDRRLLTALQCRQVQMMVEDLLELLALEPAALTRDAVDGIDRAQNRLFDEVCDLAMSGRESQRQVG